MRRALRPTRVSLGRAAACAALYGALAVSTASGQTMPPDEWLSSRIDRFTVWYQPGDEAARDAAVEALAPQLDAMASVLGQEVEGPVGVRLHPDVDSFLRANPLFIETNGVLAGSRRGLRELEIVVPIAEADGPLGVEHHLRREIARLLILARSDRMLPDAHVEGLADYLVPATRSHAAGVARLRGAWTSGQTPGWSDLAAPDALYSRPLVSGPAARSIAQYLFEREGVTGWLAAMDGVAAGLEWSRSFESAFGLPSEQLEAAWRQWLPTYLDGGWRRHELYDPDQRRAVALLEAGQFAVASRILEPAVRLIRLDDPGAADSLDAALADARTAQAAAEAVAAGMASLEEGDYAAAAAHAGSAFAADADGPVAALAEEVARRADLGIAASERMERAAGLPSWRVAEARRLAVAAAEGYWRLGNEAAAGQAASLAESSGTRLRPAGLALVMAGSLLLSWNIRRRLLERRGA